MRLKTLSEDEFLNLIATREGPVNGKGLDEKTKKKLEKEQETIRQGAKDLERREREEKRAAKAKEQSGGR